MIDGVDYDLSMRRPRKTLLAPQAKLRRRVSWGLCLGLLFFAACRQRAEPQSPSAREANVLLITVDTTRADHLGCYGSPAGTAITDRRYSGAETPHLDALAARGVRFTHATAQVP